MKGRSGPRSSSACRPPASRNQIYHADSLCTACSAGHQACSPASARPLETKCTAFLLLHHTREELCLDTARLVWARTCKAALGDARTTADTMIAPPWPSGPSASWYTCEPSGTHSSNLLGLAGALAAGPGPRAHWKSPVRKSPERLEGMRVTTSGRTATLLTCRKDAHLRTGCFQVTPGFAGGVAAADACENGAAGRHRSFTRCAVHQTRARSQAESERRGVRVKLCLSSRWRLQSKHDCSLL